MSNSCELDCPREYKVNCYINPTQDFYHMSKLHSGLIQLHKLGVIELSLVSSKPVSNLVNDPPWTPWLEIMNRRTGERRTAVVDLSDHGDYFYLDAMRRCDVYYKRNLHDRELINVPETCRPKAKPFGLNYGCRTQSQFAKILAYAVPRMLLLSFLSPRREFSILPKRFGSLRNFLGVLPVENYEQRPDRKLEAVVCFQARVFPPSGQRGDEEQWINRPRVDLIRALRKELGNRFWGGLVPDEYSNQYYPDAISDYSPRREDYVAMGKRALVGIASAPCVKTSSFKFGEYLAASRCIVSAPIRTMLPVPLTENVHYLKFTSVDECISQCMNLLENPSRAQEMRENNWEYYRKEVAPAKHVLNLLRRSFD